MRTKLQKSKEETRAAIEKEIASIATDLERLRVIIQRATDDHSGQTASASTSNNHRSDTLVN